MRAIDSKIDLRKYANSKIGMRKQRQVVYDTTLHSEDTAKNMELLWECQRYWSSLREFRNRRVRGRKYYSGDQWSDLVVNPKTGNVMTEGTYLKLQGRVPLKQNKIRQLGKNLIGQFLSNSTQSIVLTRKKTDSDVTEMLTNAIQYAHQSNMLDILDPRCFEEFIISGAPVQKLGFQYIKERNIEDVTVDNVNPHRIFFNSDIKDPRLKDLRLIGEIIDTTVDKIVSTFARNKEDEKRIRQIYASVMEGYDDYTGLTSRRNDALDFFVSNDLDKARMFEIWKLEGEWRTYVHDPLDMDNPYYITKGPERDSGTERTKAGVGKIAGDGGRGNTPYRG